MLMLGVLLAVSVYDAFYVRVDSRQTYLGYAIGIPAAGIIVLDARRLRVPPPLCWIVPLWAGTVIAYVAVALHQHTNPASLIGSDTLALAMPLLLLVAVLTRPALVSDKAVRIVLLGLAVAALVAVAVDQPSLRHDPPSSVLLAGAWLWYARQPSVFRAGSLAVLLYLSYSSGYRAHMLLWLLIGFLALRHGRRALRRALVFGAAALAVLLALGNVPLELTVGTNTRDFTFDDLSSAQRIGEVRDAWGAVSQWPLWQYPFGAGFGSRFLAHEASGSLGVDKSNGLLHHIHHGPMTMLFRGGLFGVVALGGLALAALRGVREPAERDFARLFFPLAISGLLVEFLVFNVTLYPIFGYVLAGFLALRYLPTGEVEEATQRHSEAGSLVSRAADNSEGRVAT